MADKQWTDKEIEDTLLNAEKGYQVRPLTPSAGLSETKVQAPGEVGSFVRGVGNSFLAGFQPQVAGALAKVNPWSGQTYEQARDEAEALNEAAWQTHPGYYGTGYAGGTAASLLTPGALLKGAGLAKEGVMAARGASAANKANQAAGARIPQIMEAAEAAGKPLSYSEAAAMAGKQVPVPTGPTNIGSQMWQAGKAGALPAIPAQGAARGASTVVNPAPPTPEKTSMFEEQPNQYSRLVQYLAQYGDNDEKRKAAMQLNASGQGLSDNTA